MATYQGGMTLEEANEQFMCDRCRKEGAGACGWDCILEATCSFLCRHCHRVTFFAGSLQDAPEDIICVHCEHAIKNEFKR